MGSVMWWKELLWCDCVAFVCLHLLLAFIGIYFGYSHSQLYKWIVQGGEGGSARRVALFLDLAFMKLTAKHWHGVNLLKKIIIIKLKIF